MYTKALRRTVLPTRPSPERQQGSCTVTRLRPCGSGTADRRGRVCMEDIVRWLVRPDTVNRRLELEGDFHPRRAVLQMRRYMALVEAGGLASMRPHCWLRSLGRWLHLEKHRNQSIHH
jgi:hypothetical protein